MPPTSGHLPDTAAVLASIQQSAKELAPEAADFIRDVAPVSSSPNAEGGRLKASLKGSEQDLATGASISVTTDVPYDVYVREGTGPHEIWPVQGTALRWFTAGGSIVFARHVNHPGTNPNDYPKIAEPRILALAQEHLAVSVHGALVGAT